MTRSNFDILISNSAPRVPDCGPARRQVRVLVRERTARAEWRQVRQRRLGLSLAAMLAFFAAFSGQVDQLGSDDLSFDLTRVDVGNGQYVDRIDSKSGEMLGAAVPGSSEGEIRELQIQRILDEGTVTALNGVSFEGATGVMWAIMIDRPINGKIVRDMRQPRDVNAPFAPVGREKLPFYAEYMDDFEQAIDDGQVPGRPFGTVVAEGVTFSVIAYTKDFPVWGPVTVYRGLPRVAPTP